MTVGFRFDRALFFDAESQSCGGSAEFRFGVFLRRNLERGFLSR